MMKNVSTEIRNTLMFAVFSEDSFKAEIFLIFANNIINVSYQSYFQVQKSFVPLQKYECFWSLKSRFK